MTPLAFYTPSQNGFAKARRSAIEDELRAMADAASPKLRAAIMEALRSGDSAAISALAEALERGDVGRVLALLGLDNLERRFGAVKRELRAVVAAAGQATASSAVPKVRGLVGPALDVVFDVHNPATARFIAEYDVGLIREISDSTREGVRQTIADGLAAGQNPRKVARTIRQQVGLTARQQKYVANFRAELESFHERTDASAWGLGNAKSKAPGGAGVFVIDQNGNPVDGILHRRLRDFRFDSTLARAMKSGQPIPPEKIDAMVDRYRERWLTHRAETIARQESMRAANRGSYYAWRQAIEQGAVDGGRLRKFWRTAGDERVRIAHRAIPKLNPDGVLIEEEFVTPTGTAFIPPYGVGCRCVLVYREE